MEACCARIHAYLLFLGIVKGVLSFFDGFKPFFKFKGIAYIVLFDLFKTFINFFCKAVVLVKILRLILIVFGIDLVKPLVIITG